MDSPSPSISPASPNLTGPRIVLTRGQPIEIEVANRTKQPTAIHWHGIEIESYYDGVAGWTGTAQQTTPAVQPGGSFVVRMRPLRAGTFIYHTHWHDRIQLENGIYGPLIVLPAGERFDPAIDKVFLIGFATVEPFGATLLVNGWVEPAPLQLRIGEKYRFRVINITPDNVAARVSLRKSGIPIEWRMIAKDGVDMPVTLAKSKTADLPVSVGERYDFEYQAGTLEELSFEVCLPGPKLRVTQALVFTADQPTK